MNTSIKWAVTAALSFALIAPAANAWRIPKGPVYRPKPPVTAPRPRPPAPRPKPPSTTRPQVERALATHRQSQRGWYSNRSGSVWNASTQIPRRFDFSVGKTRVAVGEGVSRQLNTMAMKKNNKQASARMLMASLRTSSQRTMANPKWVSGKPYTHGNWQITMARKSTGVAVTNFRRKATPAAPSTAVARKTPGRANQNGQLKVVTNPNWLHNRQSAMVPGQIAKRMQGQKFRDFNAFRQRFWKEVNADPVLRRGFSAENQARMRQGLAPFAQAKHHQGKRRVYELDHYREIRDGGGVYDLSNIRIKTPAAHVAKIGRTFNQASGAH